MNFHLPEATVKHMTRPHHQDIIYHDIDPLNPKLRQIDTSSTPVAKYKQLITGVFRDQLKQGMNEHLAKKAYLTMQDQHMKNQYNRMCDHNALLEKSQIQKRKDYYNAIQDQQVRRGQTFVDDNRTKNDKIQSHIKGSEGNHLFYKLQQEYDDYKKYNQRAYRNTIQEQVNQKQSILRQRRQQKQNETSNRKKIEQYVARLKQNQKYQQFSNKLQYKQQLDKLIESKSPRRNSGLQITPHQRHNPITNPIDHHVDNPYIMKKIMQRMNR